MSTSYTSGTATIEVDQADLLRALDRVSGGAAGRFVRRATEIQEGIRADARSRWPVRTGKSRDALAIRSAITEAGAKVEIGGFGLSYMRYVHWSVRTAASLDNEAATVAQRGGDAAAQEAIRKYWRRRLTRKHGQGAPSAKEAGKYAWVTYVRTPGRAAADKLIAECRDDLAELARSAHGR